MMPRLPTMVMIGLGTLAALKGGAMVLPDVMVRVAASGQAQAAAPTADAPPPATAADLPFDAPVCADADSIVAAIAEERALLTQQRADLADREAQAMLAEDSLRAERERLDTLRAQIETQVQKVETAYGHDLSKLVALYQNMKPEIAAGIMDDMDLETAVLTLSAMPERDAAQILGSVSIARARTISKVILERSRLPGDQNLTGLKVD